MRSGFVPGGVTLPPTESEDAGKVQTIGARYAHGEISLEDAAAAGCAAWRSTDIETGPAAGGGGGR